MTSLGELRAIEHQRMADERAAIEAAAEARRVAKEVAERAAREAAAARTAAERAAARAAEAARAEAEREARLRVEAEAAVERARQLVSVEHEQAMAELALRREVALRQRPRWMIAVTAIACAAACATGWLAQDRHGAADVAIAARDRAIAERDAAAEQARRSATEMDELARQVAALAGQIRDAVARGKAAQDDADRRRAQDRLLQLQRAHAALAEETHRRDDARAREQRKKPVVIPSGCLTAAICK